MTGVEDFVEAAAETARRLKRKRDLSRLNEVTKTSFIQNILFEDSRAGVEVVDLFVAVKKAKDKLEYLARCNSETFLKLSDLNREAKVFRHEYRVFLGNVKEFLAKMKAGSRFCHVPFPSATEQTDRNDSKASEKESEDKRRAEKCETKKKRDKRVRCGSCGREQRQYFESSEPSERGKADGPRAERAKARKCLCCFMSSLKKNSFDKLPALSEAFLGSFAAFLFWLQKKQEDSSTASGSSSSIEAVAKKKKETEFAKAKNSTVQMIREVCEAVNEAPSESSRKSFLKPTKETDNDLELSSGASSVSASDDSDHTSDVNSRGERKHLESRRPRRLADGICMCGREHPPSNFLTCRNQALKKSKSEIVSKFVAGHKIDERQDSESEEPRADLLTASTLFDPKGQTSVTCMGDLMTNNKGGSLLSPTLIVMPSWVEKLSTQIISKLKNKKSKTDANVFEKPNEKPDVALKALTGYLEFTVKANTPIGILDFDVIPYNKNSCLNDRMLKFNVAPIQVTSGPKPRGSSQSSSRMTGTKEDNCSWSDESLHNTETDGASNSGESELEEFAQIFVECPTDSKDENIIDLPQEKGSLKEEELKIGKSHFFEIQKCFPVYPVQDLLQRTPKTEQAERQEVKEWTSEEKIISLTAGEKCESQLVIEGSSTDLVIYIQVEMEEGGISGKFEDGIFVEYQTNSLGTQTAENSSDERTISLNEKKESGFSLYSIWKGEEKSYPADVEGTGRFIAAEEIQLQEDGPENESIDDEEKVVMVKEPKEKSVTFNDELSEIFIEKEVQETISEDESNEAEAIVAIANDVVVKNEKQRVDVWFQQNHFLPVLRGEIRNILFPVEDAVQVLDSNPMELEKALKLIREIENDVVEVKLGDAISILPRLEMELRKHLQGKLKNFGEREFKSRSSLHNFFSAIDFWPEEESADASENSEDRLNSLLIMLSNLENAVKSIENSSSSIELSHSSKIYKLLHALTVSIRELEEGPSVMSLSQTMDIASQLDTAIREYDSIVRRQPLDYITSQSEKKKRWKMDPKSVEKVPEQQHLKNVRKKVFEILEEEAIDVEGRIDKDFDRLDRLGRENDEALMFLEAFLQKTQRRLLEVSNVKGMLKELSFRMNEMYEEAKEKLIRVKEMEAEVRIIHVKEGDERSTPTSSSATSLGRGTPVSLVEPVRQTVSGLLMALDILKSKAKEKKELCKELLFPGVIEKSEEADNSSQRSSRSSFTTKHPVSLKTSIREFKKIGDTSLYLSWTKPEGPLKSSILGYQIHVNGKLNQKVRNPHRLQAVLYSVDLTNKAEIQLYAIAENSPRILLATLSHQIE